MHGPEGQGSHCEVRCDLLPIHARFERIALRSHLSEDVLIMYTGCDIKPLAWLLHSSAPRTNRGPVPTPSQACLMTEVAS